MAKAPVLGQVKTRLAKSVGNERALQIYRQLLNETLRLASAAQRRLSWRVAWHVTGTGAKDWIEGFAPAEHERKIQTGGDLGTRMQSAFAAELQQSDRVMMIGADCPQLTLEYLQAAADALSAATAVFGPARDGGYVLIGLKKMVAPLFNGPRWSSEHTLSDTLTIAEKIGIVYDLRPELQDLDTASDLAAFPTFAKEFLPFDGTQGA